MVLHYYNVDFQCYHEQNDVGKPNSVFQAHILPKKKKKEMKNFEMVKKKMYSIVKGQVQNIDFLL